MTETVDLPISAQIRAARAVIAEPEHWCRGHYGEDADGRPYGANSELQTQATSFCVVGAFAKVLNIDGWEAHGSPPVAWITRQHGYNFSLSEFNNTHTHPEVLALLDDLAARREAEEAVAAAAATN